MGTLAELGTGMVADRQPLAAQARWQAGGPMSYGVRPRRRASRTPLSGGAQARRCAGGPPPTEGGRGMRLLRAKVVPVPAQGGVVRCGDGWVAVAVGGQAAAMGGW
jgi:hypothetical protein